MAPLPGPGVAWPDAQVIWLRARSEWRRRWPMLCALTLLVGLVGAVVLTAAALCLDVGGTFDVASPSTAQWACLDAHTPPVDTRLCKATIQSLDRDRIDLSKLQGPHIHLRIVGITRSLFEVGAASHVVF